MIIIKDHCSPIPGYHLRLLLVYFKLQQTWGRNGQDNNNDYVKPLKDLSREMCVNFKLCREERRFKAGGWLQHRKSYR